MKKLSKFADESFDMITQTLLNKEESSNLKTVLKISGVSLVIFFTIVGTYLFFIEKNWSAFSVVLRSLFMAISIIGIFLFSVESFEWRAISSTIIIIGILTDIMAQVLGWYAIDTSLGGLEYDFWAHGLFGVFTTLLLTNVIRIRNNKEAWIIVGSTILGFLWEVFEFVIKFMKIFVLGDLDDFVFNSMNSIWDTIAHLVGTIISLAIYMAYKYKNCLPENRRGILCRI